MSSYLQSMTPDSFSGIIFALEGIRDATVLLNGPTGCKYYHSSVSDAQQMRQSEFDPLNFPLQWYFGQPRVPCTYLDNGDYIYGSADKLGEALDYYSEHNTTSKLLCIVNSPGASLIGDDLQSLAERYVKDRPVATFQTPGFSRDVCYGHETAAISLIEQMPPSPCAVDAHCVNVLGTTLFDRNHTGDVEEIVRLLTACGIEVNTFYCGGGTFAQMQALPRAALNVVVQPEFGLKTAQFLEERYGTAYVAQSGPPVGFSATEEFMAEICERLGVSDEPIREESERARARAYGFISRINSLTGLPKGVPFSVEGTYSELYAYVQFLTRYMGMIPVAVAPLNSATDVSRPAFERLMHQLHVEAASTRDILTTPADIVLASGQTIAQMRATHQTFCGIEKSLPTLGYVDVVPKTFLGIRGALLLIEMVLNGLNF